MVKVFTTYGASTINYEKYFKKTINELVESIFISSVKPRILFVKHDWAQYDLPEQNKGYLPKNIKTILKDIVNRLVKARYFY